MPSGSSQPIPLDTLHQMMRDPRYWNPSHPERQAWVAQVSDGFRAHYSSDMTHDPAGPQTDSAGHDGLVHVDAYVRTVNGEKVDVSEHKRAWPESGGHPQSGNHAGNDEVPKAPPGVNIDANITEAEGHWAYTEVGDLWFKNQVRNHGPWDFKRRSTEYEDFGNFNYGATGAAMGYSLNTLQRMAGWYQYTYGKSDHSWGKAPSEFEAYLGIGGKAPFGDDPKDQMQISKGFEYFMRKYKKK